MARLHLDLLGGFDCRSSAGQPSGCRRARAGRFSPTSAMQAGRHASREKLAGLLWGDRSEEQARADLRKTLSRLFSAMPMDDGAIASRSTRAASRHDLKRSTSTPSGSSDWPRMGRPKAWSGRRCFTVASCWPALMAAARNSRRGCSRSGDGWRKPHHEVLRRLLDHYVVCGAIDRAIQVALRLLGLDPLQESVHGTLMRLYMYQDRVGAALAQYRSCRDMLARELGVGPALETERLRAELLKLAARGCRRHPSARSTMCPNGSAVLRAGAEQRARRRAELSRRAVAGRPAVRRCRASRRHRPISCDGLAEDIATEIARFPRAPGHRPGERPRLPPRRGGARAGRPRAGGQLCRRTAACACRGRAVADDRPPDRGRVGPAALGRALRLRTGSSGSTAQDHVFAASSARWSAASRMRSSRRCAAGGPKTGAPTTSGCGDGAPCAARISARSPRHGGAFSRR